MLLLVVALLLIGLASGPSSAALLTRGRWQVHRPRRAIALWGALGALGLLCTLVAVLLAAALSLTISPTGPAVQSLTLTSIAWLGLGGLGIAASLLQLRRSVPGEDEVDASSSLGALLSRRRTGTWQHGASTVFEIDDPRMLAVAVPGRPGTIFVSRSLRRALPAPHLTAVLAHEQAHLGQHHLLLRQLGAWHCACLPKRSRLRRDLAARLTLLTDLAADDVAAARIGPAVLHRALTGLHEHAPPRELAVRAARVHALSLLEDGPRRGPAPGARQPCRDSPGTVFDVL